MSADEIRATGPAVLKMTLSERKFEELSENVDFYPFLMYSCWVMPLLSERFCDTSKLSVLPFFNWIHHDSHLSFTIWIIMSIYADEVYPALKVEKKNLSTELSSESRYMLAGFSQIFWILGLNLGILCMHLSLLKLVQKIYRDGSECVDENENLSVYVWSLLLS